MDALTSLVDRFGMALAIMFLVAGCMETKQMTTDKPELDLSPITLIGKGLIQGQDNAFTFGVDKDGLIDLLSRFGSVSETRNDECGAGPMEFAAIDGLTLNFQDDKFVGWSLGKSRGDALKTSDGLYVGMMAASTVITQNYSSVGQSSLGREFRSGRTGISGLIDGMSKASKVTDLWAGTNCIFR